MQSNPESTINSFKLLISFIVKFFKESNLDSNCNPESLLSIEINSNLYFKFLFSSFTSKKEKYDYKI